MILVECNADEALLRALGVAGRRIQHHQGRDNVLLAVRKGAPCTAMVDEDPSSPLQSPELKNYQTEEKLDTLRYMRHMQEQGKRLIVVCPRLEEWMLNRAKINGIDPAEFGLPSDPRELHHTTRYYEQPRFRDFLNELIAKDAEMCQLKSWLQQAL